MDFKPSIDDVLFTPRQRAVRKELYELVDKLETEYRKTDPDFSLSALRAYDFVQGINGVDTFGINTKIDSVLQTKLQAIKEQIFRKK